MIEEVFFPRKYFTVKDPLLKKGSISVFTGSGLIHQSYSLHRTICWCMIPLYLTQSVNTYFTYVLQWNNHIPQTVEIKTGRNMTLCTVWQMELQQSWVYLFQNKTVFRNRFASHSASMIAVNWKLCCQSSHLWSIGFEFIHQTEPDLCLFQTT